MKPISIKNSKSKQTDEEEIYVSSTAFNIICFKGEQSSVNQG
jgi:hypothetical protein